jgi:hypothetical protein
MSFYEKLSEKKYELVDMLIRKTDWLTDRYNSSSFHELSNRIRIYYEFYRITLIKEKISLVIFFDAPHMGWDYILYEVAKSYGIKTLLLCQSKLPNKFFQYSDFEDFGTFKTSKSIGDISRFEISEKGEKDPFSGKKTRRKISEFPFKKLLSLPRYKNRISGIVEKNDYLRLIREFGDKNRRAQSFFRFDTERNYKKELKKIITSEYSLTNKYVYFPLHRAPEKVTSAWAGMYLDQVLAIEKLSKLIPRDWFIYVKEHPGQLGAYRDVLFFERLKLIPNLLFLSTKANTFDLMKNSQFNATIVGTAGWESITRGKNVLTFGWGAWYRGLPGVYEYSEDMNLNDLINTKIDHTLLEEKTGMLWNKCGTGVVRPAIIKFVQNFSITENTRTVAESICKILY